MPCLALTSWFVFYLYILQEAGVSQKCVSLVLSKTIEVLTGKKVQELPSYIQLRTLLQRR